MCNEIWLNLLACRQNTVYMINKQVFKTNIFSNITILTPAPGDPTPSLGLHRPGALTHTDRHTLAHTHEEVAASDTEPVRLACSRSPQRDGLGRRTTEHPNDGPTGSEPRSEVRKGQAGSRTTPQSLLGTCAKWRHPVCALGWRGLRTRGSLS